MWTGEIACNSCLLQMRNASYLQATAVKSILANRKLSISHSKGMNNGVDDLSHLDLLWGKIFCPTLRFDCGCKRFENSCFKPNHDSTQ